LEAAALSGFLPVQTRLGLLRKANPAIAEALHGCDPDTNRYYARIMLRARERQPAWKKKELIKTVERICREEFPDPGTDPTAGAQVTGFFVLLASLIESTVRDQWVTFGIASGVIFLMMVAAVRSLKMAAIAMVPNVIPILAITGLMGWLGVRINMGAAMIAAVSVGLSIDSSIHYLIAFQRLIATGYIGRQALWRVQHTVGRAATLSTLALIIGFAGMMFSDFVPTIYFGALSSLAMLGGLFGNVVVLPLLLHLFSPRGAAPERALPSDP
jgi:hypothetical protein